MGTTSTFVNMISFAPRTASTSIDTSTLRHIVPSLILLSRTVSVQFLVLSNQLSVALVKLPCVKLPSVSPNLGLQRVESPCASAGLGLQRGPLAEVVGLSLAVLGVLGWLTFQG